MILARILSSRWNLLNHFRFLLLIFTILSSPGYISALLWMICSKLGDIRYTLKNARIPYYTSFESSYNLTLNVMTQMLILVLIPSTSLLWYVLLLYKTVCILCILTNGVNLEHLYLVTISGVLGNFFFYLPDFVFQILIYLNSNALVSQTAGAYYLYLISYLSTILYLFYHLYQHILKTDPYIYHDHMA